MAQQFSRNVTLTSDSVAVAFGLRPNYIRIDASTAGTAYITFNTTIATTASSADSNSYQLTSGAAPIVFDGHGTERNGMSSGFNAVTAAGSTTLIRVFAVRI